MITSLNSAIERNTLAPVSAAMPISQPAILFALSEWEMDIFFANRNPSVPQGQPYYHTRRKQGWLEQLEALRPEVIVSCWTTPEVPAAWLEAPGCPLRYVCHLTGSVRGVLPRTFLERGGRVTNWGGLVAPQVAEHALLLMLACLRNLPEWRPDHFRCKLGTKTLFGKTVGLHGFGQIARALRELLRPFGVRVRAYSQGVPAEYMAEHEVEALGSLKELFAGSDVVVECEALTDESAGSVTAEILAALPDGGVFVNVGRGLVVDEPALIREAESGRIGVALDVVAHEPLSPDSKLATLPNVIHSPHLAAPTGDQFIPCGTLALENLQRYVEGLPLEREVTLEIYDRAT